MAAKMGALIFLLVLALSGASAEPVHEQQRDGTCRGSTRGKEHCPNFLPPPIDHCAFITSTCSNSSGMATVTLRNCLRRTIDFFGVEYQSGNSRVCAKSSRNVKPRDIIRVLTLPCGSFVNLFWHDSHFFNRDPLDFGRSPCGGRVFTDGDGRRLHDFKCSTCGPFKLPVICRGGEQCEPAGNSTSCDGGKVFDNRCRCRVQKFKLGNICRPAVPGGCDIEERCDGHSLDCPKDKLANKGTLCRQAVGKCDKPAFCDGESAVCPPNKFWDRHHKCREATFKCELPAFCRGPRAKDPKCPDNPVRPRHPPFICRTARESRCHRPVFCDGRHRVCEPDRCH